MAARPPLTDEQVQARERWQAIWNLPILLAALIPLFVTSPNSRAVEIFVGAGSWLVFAIDLFVQRRIDPHYGGLASKPNRADRHNARPGRGRGHRSCRRSD